jgi:signal transduction histidine kinase
VSSHDLRIGVGVAGTVADQGRPIYLGNVPEDVRFGSAHSETQSVVCVPIQINDAVIGVIYIESDKPQAFAMADQQFLETVSGQIALSIEKAHLYSRVRKRTKQEATGVSESAPQIAEPERKLDESLEESEARFRVMVKELQAQNEELNAFNHTVAHDLKNPLSILLGFAEVLSQDYGGGADEVLDQGIRVILENGRRMEIIISELLLLAEVRQLDEITVEPLDMASIVVETRNRLSHHIAEYEAKIIVPAAWPTAVGHRPWVEEIWVNYLSNAIKYGGTPPKVELGAMVQSDGMVRYWVRDNGVGISKSDQKRLFVPFTKLKQVNTKGHGLGLSIVQRITIKLGGTVGVDSEPGMGSLFWFTLPIA